MSNGQCSVVLRFQAERAQRKPISNLGGSAAAASAGQRLAPELVDAVVGAARFVFDRIGRLKQDMAAARLEMLRGLCPKRKAILESC